MTAPGLPAARPAGAGFTLVELLVALTLVGLISLVLFGGLRFGTRAWEAGTSRGEESRRVAIVQSLLRRQLSQAVLPARRSREVDAPQAFDGTAESIQFVAPLSAHVGFGGLYRFELVVERAAVRRRLVLRWQPYRADQLTEFDDETMEERDLIDGIDGAVFRYFGPFGARQLPAWHDRWALRRARTEEDPAALPELVSLTVRFPPEDRRRWPEFIVAPRSTVVPSR